MKKLVLALLLIGSNLHAQTFFNYYSSTVKARGVYFVKDTNGYWLQSYTYIYTLLNNQFLHIDESGDTISTFYTNHRSPERIADNIFLAVTSIRDTSGPDTIVVSELDTLGNETTLFKFRDTTDVLTHRILLTSDSSYLIAGQSETGITSWANLYKTDLQGNIKWKQTLMPNLSCDQNVTALQETNDHHYLLLTYHSCCCHTYPGGLFLARFDSSGNVEWTKGFSEDWTSFEGQLIQTGNDYLLVGYDSIIKISSAGNTLWQKPNKKANLGYTNIANGIVDGFYACGFYQDTSINILITRFNDIGDSLFSFIYSGPDQIYGEFIRQLPDGRIACTGGQTSGTGNTTTRQAFFLVCDSLGNIVTSSDQLIKRINEINLYPNPANSILYLTKSISITWGRIYNSTGQMVKEISSGFVNKIDVGDLQPGIYFLVTNDRNLNFKFLKE